VTARDSEAAINDGSEDAAITMERRPSGSIKLSTKSDDGLTFEAIQSPLTQRVSIPGQYLHIIGPLEHKRPQKAMYDLRHGLICDWPDNRNERRRERFNKAAHRLIGEAERLTALRFCRCCGIDPAEEGRTMCAACLEVECLLSSHCDRST
jgi:hypothetical protein